MEAQRAVREGAGVGRQERPLTFRQRAVALHRRASAAAADVADLTHDLAGAVGVDEGSNLPRDCGIEQLQFAEAVGRRVEPLQQHDAAAVLQFAADLLREGGKGGQRDKDRNERRSIALYLERDSQSAETVTVIGAEWFEIHPGRAAAERLEGGYSKGPALLRHA